MSNWIKKYRNEFSNVYLVWFPEWNLHKIGVALDVVDRIKDIAHDTGTRVVLVHSVRVPRARVFKVEAVLHSVYDAEKADSPIGSWPGSTELFHLNPHQVEQFVVLAGCAG